MRLFFSILIMLFLTACGDNKPSNTTETDTVQKETTSKTDKNTNQEKSVELLKVNSHIITNRILGKNAHHFFDLSKNAKKQLLNKLADDELMIQYALSQSKDNNFSSENDRAKKALVILKDLSSKNIGNAINDENLSKVYEKNKEQYYHKQLFEASHIFVKTEKEAKEIIEELKKADDFNTAFQKMAIAKSIGKTAKAGGYLGFFPAKIMETPFIEALMTLKDGEWYQKPVKTKKGWHVVRLHKMLMPGYFSFDLVKKQIKAEIEQYERDLWSDQKLQELKKKADIVYLYDVNSK